MSKSVSIIIPCYNAAPYLRETIASTLAQTFPATEVLVVDDGSTDDSAAIAESFGPPVRVLRQKNQGESTAMNAALAVARGEFIVFLGADDVLAPGLLEAQLRRLEGTTHAVACTGFAFFKDDVRHVVQEHLPTETSFFPGVITANLAPASCWMTPKTLILQAGCYHAPQQYFEDWDLWWRIAMTGAAYLPIQTVGFYYRQHAKSQLASLRDAERAYGHAWLMERMCRAFLDREDLLEAYGDRLFWSALTSVRASRSFGVSWERLRLASNMIEEVAKRRPPRLWKSSYARAVARLGVRRAEMIFGLVNGRMKAPSYRPAWMRNDAAPIGRPSEG